MGLVESLKRFGAGLQEGQTMEALGPNWRADREAKMLSNARVRAELERYQAEGPAHQRLLEGQAANQEAMAAGRPTADQQMGMQRQKGTMQFIIAQAKLEAARELNPEKRAKLEAEIAKLSAATELIGAQTTTANIKNADPETYLKPSAAAPQKPQLRQTEDAEGNAVWSWIMPGQEGVKVAPPAQRQIAGMVDEVQSNIAKMKELAGTVTSGPIAGRASKAYQSVFGPEGPEGDFDFYGNALIDAVYIKSGKQINAQEMATLRQMIPNRARGNLPRQVELFEQYANGLLSRYGKSAKKPAAAARPAAPVLGEGNVDGVGPKPPAPAAPVGAPPTSLSPAEQAILKKYGY